MQDAKPWANQCAECTTARARCDNARDFVFHTAVNLVEAEEGTRPVPVEILQQCLRDEVAAYHAAKAEVDRLRDLRPADPDEDLPF